MNVEQCIADQIRASISTKQAILSDKGLMRNIAAAAQMIVDAYEQGKKTLLAGNGGSAADAQHIAGEFVSKFYFDRPRYCFHCVDDRHVDHHRHRERLRLR